MKTEVYDLIMELGGLLTDYNHQWSDELRNKFEKITKNLQQPTSQTIERINQILVEVGGIPIQSNMEL